MQKADKGSLRRKAAAIVALLAVCATAVGGTFAWQDYKQHKSNELSGSQIKYEARLVEDFEEVFDWKCGEDIKKEIRVANVGKAAAGYGDVYVRLQLKEFMQIGDMIFVETEERYMVAKGGQTYTVSGGKTYTFADGYYVVFDSEGDAKSVFPNNTVKYLEDKVTGDKGWFIETKAGDVNGQYGKHVVTDYDFGPMAPVIPGSEFCPVDERNHHGYTDPTTGEFITWSKECDYPIHTWTDPDGPEYRAYIKEYIEWILGDDVIFMSDWDGTPVAAWIIDDEFDPATGWAYWGQALAPETSTSNILEKVVLINQPDGNFYYVIHVDMEALSIDEFLKPDGEGEDWATKPKDSYVNNRPTITWNGTPPSAVKAGETVQSPGVTVGPAGAAQGPLTWSSSNPAIATVDQNGVVTGVKEGGPVTIIVKAPNGARGQYSITVTAGDPITKPATDVSFVDGNDIALTVGQTKTLAITKTPADTTDVPVFSIQSGGSFITLNTTTGAVTGTAAGTAVVKVTLGSVSDTITVTVSAATKPATGVSFVDGDSISLNIGQTKTPAITKTPADTTDVPVFSIQSGGSFITLNTTTGAVTGTAAGTAVVKVTLGSVSDTITVTVNPDAPQNIPTLNGEGPYNMVGDEDDSKSYSLSVTINADEFDNGDIDRPGTIKLKDILSPGFNYSGMTVTANPTSLNSKVSLGKDKDNDDAIVITYYGTKADWDAAYALPGKPYPQVQMILVLHKAGYADTQIKVNVAFEGSFYG